MSSGKRKRALSDIGVPSKKSKPIVLRDNAANVEDANVEDANLERTNETERVAIPAANLDANSEITNETERVARPAANLDANSKITDETERIARAKFPPTHIRNLIRYRLYDLAQHEVKNREVIKSIQTEPAKLQRGEVIKEYMTVPSAAVKYSQNFATEKELQSNDHDQPGANHLPSNYSVDVCSDSDRKSDYFDSDIVAVIGALIKVGARVIIENENPGGEGLLVTNLPNF